MMKTIFLKELKRTRTGLIIWSIIAGLVAFMGIMEYPVLGQNLDLLEEALDLIPKLGQLIFGVYNVNINDPIGYYIVMYYWTGLIIFVHAIYTGASIISKESRDKTAEYLFTKPYPKSTIVTAKMFTALVNILVVGLMVTVLSLLAMIPITSESAVYGQVFTACIGMLITQGVLLMLGLLCSALFKGYKAGVFSAVGILLLSYCIMFFVQYIDAPQLGFLSPLTFFSVSEVVRGGLGLLYVLLSAVIITLCVYFTQRLYAKKEMIV
jgi:ABC-2 type transport system permease protein